MGLEEYGLCAAAQGVQPEVPDALHPRLSKQAGTGPLNSPEFPSRGDLQFALGLLFLIL